jgi:PleD family two-component response regulator
MAKQDRVVKLLLIEDSVEEAEQLISVLRNGGIALRPARADSAESLAQQLEEQTPDVILVNTDAKSLKLADVAAQAALGGKDIAVIAVVKKPSEADIVAAFNDGARALALRNRAEHVQSIVKREFDSLNMRRGVRRLESALRETERRCDALLDSSRDPIAYVHEGMHVRANRAYLRCSATMTSPTSRACRFST